MFNKKNKNKKEDSFKLGLNKFFAELKKRKKESVTIFILIFFSYLPHTSIPFLQGKILDSLISPQHQDFWGISLDMVFIFLGILLILRLFEFVSDLLLFQFASAKISNDVYKSYIKESFSKIITFPVSFFKKKSLGKTIYSVNTASDKLSNSFVNINDILGFPIMILLNFSFLFFISWEAASLVLIINIIFTIHFFKNIEKRKKTTKDYNDEKKNASSFLTENINFSIELKKNNNEKRESKSIASFLETKFQDSFYRKMIFNIKNYSVVDIIFWFSTLFIFLIIIYLFKTGSMSAGDFVAILIYFNAVNRNIHFMIKNVNNYIEDFTIIGDTEKLLQNTPENYSEGKIRVDVEGEVEFRNVDFSYDDEQGFAEQNPADTQSDSSNGNPEAESIKVLSLDHKDNKNGPSEELYESKDLKPQRGKSKLSLKKIFSLSNINLKIEKGSKIAFVGESGGGKSTSVELVGGFYFPNKGDILIDGISTKEINLNDLRSSIAYVSQDIAIFNTTIGENISYGLNEEISEERKNEKINEAAKLANISDFIDSLPDGYDTKVGEKGLKLSGGQKQRIAIARAILRNPKILILDEPTSALDIESETKITSALKGVMRNRTTIIIAHRISTVRDADNIFVFKEGKIVESGNYQNLISQNGEFKKMVNLHEGLN